MLERPRFKPHLHLEALPGEGIIAFSETDHVILPGSLFASVAAQLDGRAAEAIVASLSREAEGSEVRRVLEQLERQGLLTESDDDGTAAESGFWASCGVDPVVARRRLAESAVSLTTVGQIDPTSCLDSLRLLGVRILSEAPRQVVLADDYLREELRQHNETAIAAERDWLLIKPQGYVVWLGPLFRRGETGCWECLAERLRANRDAERFLARRQPGRAPLALGRLGSSEATEQIATRVAALSIASWLARDACPELEGAVVTLDLRSWRSETHRVVARPQCRACGDSTGSERDVAQPLVLKSRRKTFTADGGHRTQLPEVTVARFQHHVSPISGAVSRLVPNGVQREGILHAYVAGSNFSRPPQSLALLRDGLRARTGGKGATDAQARASALCEALERHSGVFQGDEPRRQARLTELGDAAIHPNACMGFSDAQYRERARWNARGEMTQAVPLPFDEDARVSWTPVWSLSRGETRYLPTAFCFYDYPVFPEAAFCIACSNGNAAGNTIEEAILQGFLELVERDSVALWWYCRARRPRLALESFDEPYVHRVEAYLAERSRDLVVLDLTADLRIPVFAAVSRRHDRLPQKIVLGFGAHLDPRIALLRAVTELNQMLMRVLWSERQAPPIADVEPSVCEWLAGATVADHPHLAADTSVPARRAGDFARCWSEDLRDDVLYCQSLVEARAMELLVLDQTRPDIGLPVVKVIVPGLRHFWPRFAPGRLYAVPVDLGWLALPLSEAQLNPVSMFL